MVTDMSVTMGHSCLESIRLENIPTTFAYNSVCIGTMFSDLESMYTDMSFMVSDHGMDHSPLVNKGPVINYGKGDTKWKERGPVLPLQKERRGGKTLSHADERDNIQVSFDTGTCLMF